MGLSKHILQRLEYAGLRNHPQTLNLVADILDIVRLEAGWQEDGNLAVRVRGIDDSADLIRKEAAGLTEGLVVPCILPIATNGKRGEGNALR